ncbi:PKD domain-containing protein [Aquimarina pacifica]|uniref:PKD domain-containing protein n=1 Tax=Aquimarina pacifica TaxID=1296415 RepID=UPI0004726815|nr:PKD domain-containing protein [Aquimarina pacifica]
METSDGLKSTHIDKSIVLFFVITMLVTATVFAFKFVNHKPCEIVDFEANSKNYRAGDIIRFKDNTLGAIKRKWDFGDSSKVDLGAAPFHTFEKPGEYTVRLLVNDRCEGEKTIVIKEKAFVLDSTRIANFDLPASIKVGDTLRLKDKTKEAVKWEWRFGETAEINSKKKNPTYVYESTGLKTITLVVNGDPRYGIKKKIEVLPSKKVKKKTPKRNRVQSVEATSVIKYAPSEVIINDRPKEEFRAPDIKDSAFKAKLMDVSKKKASAKDFSAYLCDNLQMPMTAKNKKMTFLDFCNKIKGKSLVIKEIEIFRNKKNNCIEYITVQYTRTGLF